MMRIVPMLLIAILLVLTTQAQQENKGIPSTMKIYNEEGKVQMTITYNPACNCKIYSEFFSDGKLLAKRTFKVEGNKEIVDGEDITYFRDGSIQIYKLWKDALPVGRFYFNHDDGRLEHEELYEGKYKAGTWKYYDNFGRILREQIYESNVTFWNSKKDKATYKYYQNGALIRTERLQNGMSSSNNNTSQAKSVAAPTITATDGKTLFQLKCKACHDPIHNGYGPALKNFNKTRSEAWLFQWVKNAEELLLIEDKAAKQLHEEWGNKKHPIQLKLNDEQIRAIIKYVKAQ